MLTASASLMAAPPTCNVVHLLIARNTVVERTRRASWQAGNTTSQARSLCVNHGSEGKTVFLFSGVYLKFPKVGLVMLLYDMQLARMAAVSPNKFNHHQSILINSCFPSSLNSSEIVIICRRLCVMQHTASNVT